MTAITYTAMDRLAGGTSCLVAGHLAGTDYTLETDAERLDPTDNEKRHVNAAVDGTLEVLLDEISEGWEVTTAHVPQNEQAAWREFFGSVRAGEAFIFDAYGTAAVPDNPQTVKLMSGPKITRVFGMVMQYSFSVKVFG